MTHIPQRPLTRREEAMLIASLWAFTERKMLAAAERNDSVAAQLTANRTRLASCRDRFAALRGPR